MGKTKTFPTKTELTPLGLQETMKENLRPPKVRKKKEKRSTLNSELSLCASVSG